MLARANLNNDFLLQYSLEHVWYETHMTFDVGFLLDNSGVTSDNEYFRVVLRNLVIEGFPVHLRNLLDFFYPTAPTPRPTDVLAAHYFATGKLPKGFPSISRALKEARKRTHKEVSHLTTLRKSPHEREGWRAKPLLHDLVWVIQYFVEHASESKLHREYVGLATARLDQFSRNGV